MLLICVVSSRTSSLTCSGVEYALVKEAVSRVYQIMASICH